MQKLRLTHVRFNANWTTSVSSSRKTSTGGRRCGVTQGLLVEEDAVLLLDGQFAIEDSEDFPLSSGLFQNTVAREEPRLGLVQRFSGHVHQTLFRQYHLLLGC